MRKYQRQQDNQRKRLKVMLLKIFTITRKSDNGNNDVPALSKSDIRFAIFA